MNRLIFILVLSLSACNNTEGTSNFLKSLRPGADLFGPKGPSQDKTSQGKTSQGKISLGLSAGKSTIRPSKDDQVSEANSISNCPAKTTRLGKAFPRGTKQWCAYKDDDGTEIRHGEFRQWNTNGSIAVKASYADNELEGDYQSFYPEGEIKENSKFINGRKEGLSINFTRDGTKKSEVNYKNDTLNGLYTEYSRSGSVLTKGTFINDKKNGIWEEYDQKGSLKTKVEYVDGSKHGKAIGYSKNGSPSTQGMFSVDLEIGHWVIFNNQGQKKAEGNFIEGKKHGRWVDYNNNLQPIRNTFYDMGKKGESYSVSTNLANGGGFGKKDILGEEPLPDRYGVDKKDRYSSNTQIKAKKRDNKPGPLEKEGWSAM